MSHYHRSLVWEWVFELVDKQRQKNEGRVDITEDTIAQHSETKPRVADTRVEAEKKMRRGENVSRENVSNSTDVTSEEDKDIVFLKEMFPDLMDETLRSIHRQCRGDMDKTIQKLLQLSEQEKVAGKQQAVTVLPKVRPQLFVNVFLVICPHALSCDTSKAQLLWCQVIITEATPPKLQR